METLTEKDFKPQTAEQPPNMTVFTNPTGEDFTYTFNKVPKTFKAGVSVLLERGLAEHFAKHLTNRELLKEGRENDTSPKVKEDNPFFMAWYNKCLASAPAETLPVIETPRKVEAEPTKKKVGRPKIKKEEEFEEVPVPDDDSDN